MTGWRRTHHIIIYGFLWAVAAWTAGCGDDSRVGGRDALRREDREAKRDLQGIWIDRETETVAFRAKGDTIFYPDTANAPVRFFVCDDTLFLAGGGDTAAYPIDRRGGGLFHFHSATGDIVRLVRSENPDDSIYFSGRQAATLTYSEVVKKDTVVFCDGERYHCYVYVNPSHLKVSKTSYTDEGIAVKNVYYDNVIHICVYKGKVCLFSRDYTRKSFEGLVPEGFLSQAILSNMVFSGIDRAGFRFDATVCIPDGASCYMVRIRVGYDGKPTMELIEY